MKCPICNQELSFINFSHAKKHNKTPKEIKKEYPDVKISRLDGKFMPLEQKKKISKKTKGINNGMYGKKHNKEVRKKISENQKGKVLSDEHKKKISNSMMGDKNHFYGKSHDEITKLKMSKIKSESIANGKIKNNGYGQKGWYYSIKNNDKFYYDSYLELMRMEQLDENKDILSWTKRHKIKIPYDKKNFVPDFLITLKNGNLILEETKGYDRFKKQKKEVMKKYCFEKKIGFSWIDQKDMKGYRKWLKKRN